MVNKNDIKTNEINQELKEISPTLADIKKSNPFVVKDNYFDELYNNIQNKVSNESKAPAIKEKIWFLKPQYSISIAAAIIILVAFAINYFSENSNDKQNIIEKTFIAKDNNSTIENQNINSNHKKDSDESEKLNIDNVNSKENILLASEKQIDNPLLEQTSKNNPSKKVDFDKVNNQNKDAVYAINNDNNPIKNPGISMSNSGNPANNNSDNLARHTSTDNKQTNKDSLRDATKPSQNYKKPFVDLGEDICSNEEVELTAGKVNSKYSYLWSNGEKTSSINVDKTGKYSVTVSLIDNPEIYSVDNIQVKIIDKPIVNLGPDQEICSNEKLTLYAIENNKQSDYTYKWLPNGETSSFIQLSKLDIGTYKFKVTVVGCENYTDEILITVNDCQLEIPNVFTPNGDGVNDYFKIAGLENYPNSKLIIFTRNGNKVYESLNYLNNWDGGNNPDGVYFFKLFIADENQTIRQGSVTLYRK
ncbi:MAG: gliding motility-associated C-terminal domain-containing protein [Saprospiraceae bacterium]|nr:gliding motility-associated C-terminal domain-containing protein [Saprospiraceae bacterium]